MLINTGLAVSGNPSTHLPPLRPYWAGSSGAISVDSHIATSYIEKGVYRMGSAQSASWQRSLDQSAVTFSNVRTEGPSHAGSSQDHLGGVDPTVGLRPDLSQSREFTMQDNRLLVVYDSRLIGAKIYGHVGGSDRQVEPLLAYPDRRSAA